MSSASAAVSCTLGPDLLQAGPLLVSDGEVAYEPEADEEGFKAAAHQFDPDPTEGRHPHAALGLAGDRIYAVVSDGRSRRDAGLTLVELARLMAAVGCREAINLDGGGSATLISSGRSGTSRGANLRRRSRAAGPSLRRWCSGHD